MSLRWSYSKVRSYVCMGKAQDLRLRNPLQQHKFGDAANLVK
jgi:hypothetical protein